MRSPKQIFNTIKHYITGDRKTPDQEIDAIVRKIIDQAQYVEIKSTEPGVEIAQGLSVRIDNIIKDAISSGNDLSVVSRAILLGAFRCSQYIHLEAHKTIRLLLEEIIRSVFNYRGDIRKTINGILAGIMDAAREHQLNVDEALIIAQEDIFFAAEKIDLQFLDDIKTIISDESIEQLKTPG